MSDSQSPGDEPLRHVPVQLTDSEGRQVWVVQSSVGSSTDPDPGFSIFIAQLPDMMLRHWLLMTLAMAVAGGLGVAYLLYAQPVYGVGAEILVERRASALDEFSRMKGGNEFLATQAEILHSPTMIEPALEGVADALFSDPEVDPLSEALKLLSVTPVRGTDVLAINFRAPEQEAGAKFVAALLQGYGDFLYNIEFAAHNEALELLVAREAELRIALVELKARHKESQLAALEHALATGSSAVPEGTVDELLLEQLQEAKARRSALKSTLASRHPDRRAVESEIALLTRRVRSLIRAEIGRLKLALATYRAEQSRLEPGLDGEPVARSVSEIERASPEDLLAEIAQTSEIHDRTVRMLAEKQLAVGALDHAGVIVRVLSAPSAAAEKIWPRSSLVMLPCVLIGLIGGIGLALVSERRRETVTDYLAPAPELGSLPARGALNAPAEAGSKR